MGFYKLDRLAAPRLQHTVEQWIASGRDDEEYEEAFRVLFKACVFGYELVGDLPWTEVDFPEDITKAEQTGLAADSGARNRAMGAAMSSRAIVLIPATATLADLLQAIAGVPALLRLLLCAQRAGLGEILLLGVNRYPRSMQVALTRDARLTARLVCVDDQPWSALSAGMPRSGEGVVGGRPMGPACRRGHRRDTAPQRRPAGGIPPNHRHRSRTQAISMSAVPFFRVSGAWLQPIVQASGDVVLSALLLLRYSAATANAYQTRGSCVRQP